jgi:hypothetical protein
MMVDRPPGLPCQRSYTTVISELLRVKLRGLPNRKLAYSLWLELKAAYQQRKPSEFKGRFSAGVLDAAAMRAGMNACVEYGKIEEAEKLLAYWRSTGRPSRGCFNIMIKYYCKRGEGEGGDG